MFYILCEGSEGAAEYAFYNAVIEEFAIAENIKFKMYSSNGNRNILDTFYNILKELNQGDTFILLFDSVEHIFNRKTYDILNEIEDICVRGEIVFKYSTYYCFEELFLSYDGLLKMSADKLPSDLFNTLEVVHDSINKNVDYYRNKTFYMINVLFKENLSAGKTREKCAKALCYEVTKRLDGRFTISSSKIGNCWIKDCDDVILHINVCNKCLHPCKKSIFRDKLNDLYRKSILRFSSPFPSVFG